MPLIFALPKTLQYILTSIACFGVNENSIRSLLWKISFLKDVVLYVTMSYKVTMSDKVTMFIWSIHHSQIRATIQWAHHSTTTLTRYTAFRLGPACRITCRTTNNSRITPLYLPPYQPTGCWHADIHVCFFLHVQTHMHVQLYSKEDNGWQ